MIDFGLFQSHFERIANLKNELTGKSCYTYYYNHSKISSMHSINIIQIKINMDQHLLQCYFCLVTRYAKKGMTMRIKLRRSRLKIMVIGGSSKSPWVAHATHDLKKNSTLKGKFSIHARSLHFQAFSFCSFSLSHTLLSPSLSFDRFSFFLAPRCCASLQIECSHLLRSQTSVFDSLHNKKYMKFLDNYIQTLKQLSK